MPIWVRLVSRRGRNVWILLRPGLFRHGHPIDLNVTLGMQIHISPRDVKLTPAIHTYVAQKIEALEHFGLNLIGAHVALWHDDKRAFKHAFVVKVHLALPGPDIYAEDHGHDLYQAIDLVHDRLAEQLRHRKSRLVKGTREKSRKAKLKRQVALA